MTLEDIFMDPVVQGAIITVAGTIIIAVIGGFIKIIVDAISGKKRWQSVEEKIGSTQRGSLSDQHTDIINKIDSTSKIQSNGQRQINGSINRISAGVDSVNKILQINEEREKNRYENLSDSQKKIDYQIEGVKAAFAELRRLQIENQVLQQRIQELEKSLDRYRDRGHDEIVR